MIKRIRVNVTGIVQGVGFRPFVYNLASGLGLGGFVLNDSKGVTVEVEGDDAAISAFLNRFETEPPPLTKIESVRTDTLTPTGIKNGEFVIVESKNTGVRSVLISPDIATCADCLKEMNDPEDRRYRYPFINCTNCGPRYTIIKDIPYDRARTTMATFEMCPECRREYEDPKNRRFHAEPTCCPVCGPKVELLNRNGNKIICENPIDHAVQLLSEGKILAVKGLGGFHLACDAENDEAVVKLRRRKERDKKPFALMARDMAAIRRIAEVPDSAEEILVGTERPVLLLKKRADSKLPEEIAPNSASFGLMLPYTPLHHLLLKSPLDILVMTSGNQKDEPIAYGNADAKERLGFLADFFLVHDRDIHIRTDDSVSRFIAGKNRFIRRSRGYAPFPVKIPVDTSGGEILSVGAELNNTVGLTRGENVFLSHHIGDLQNVSAYEAFLEATGHLKGILEVRPKYIAHDLHPDYLSTRFVKESGLIPVPVQHHHAHIASVLAETGYTDKVIGVSFDGLGLGTDGALWGGEFLICDLEEFERVGHIAPVPQPGGDAAARRPDRMAYVYLLRAFGDEAPSLYRELLPSLDDGEVLLMTDMMGKGVNSPLTTGVGRLFDAVSALIGICTINTYHSQAPMELEATAEREPGEEGHYPAEIVESENGVAFVETNGIIRGIVDDIRRGVGAPVVSARFHNSVAEFTLDMTKRLRDAASISAVALSGGVFINRFLTERLVKILMEDGFDVMLNGRVPAGDGGIALGQAAVAAWRNR
ncbi:MAG: carbamoyltransferase HypF [Deltaproteobacteria bacterium]|uniref:Carbamoyltransferase n=1 Tax=Candidatus Zymogenus saltonus TaxID=2844893 RepID=A0A9D8KGD0_9DELT|nr:carbamoyltransferase HypF [Candidatus Zymogenus saltonus]